MGSPSSDRTQTPSSPSAKASGRRSVSLSIFVPVLLIAIFSSAVAVYGLATKQAPVAGAPKAASETPATDQATAALAKLESGDAAGAIAMLRQAAESGDALAQARLGDLFLTGSGVRRNMDRAFEWYRKAAEAGNAEAQYALAEMYAYGYGVKQDTAKASEWSAKAVANGYGAEERPDEKQAAGQGDN